MKILSFRAFFSRINIVEIMHSVARRIMTIYNSLPSDSVHAPSVYSLRNWVL